MSRVLKATATPLASIFGSGFLVIVPILAGSAGPLSLPAMAIICAVAYAIGSVIRFNITRAEPLIDSRKALRETLLFERLSDFALVPAYTISVCLYLRILSSFMLSGVGTGDIFHQRVVTTVFIVFITLVGVIKGLKMLQKLESWALWTTMGVIVVMICGFAIHDASALARGGFVLPASTGTGILHAAAVLGGTLICVQGFETSRYLKEEYDGPTRVRSCRLSQIISTSVYLVFIAVATPLMVFLTGPAQDNSLIILARHVAIFLPLPLVAAAVLSQFSAAVADTLGGEGNMVEASRNRISHRTAYLAMGAGGLALTWTAGTFQIVALASRAFALYYLFQCMVAFTLDRGVVRRIGIMVLALVLLLITLFAVPVG